MILSFSRPKTLYTYMFTRPGKKLNFMGNEIGQFREWDEKRECDWSLLEYPKHREFQKFIERPAVICISQNRLSMTGNTIPPASAGWRRTLRRSGCMCTRRMSAGQNYIVVINMSDEQYNNFEFGYDRNAVLARGALRREKRVRRLF